VNDFYQAWLVSSALNLPYHALPTDSPRPQAPAPGLLPGRRRRRQLACSTLELGKTGHDGPGQSPSRLRDLPEMRQATAGADRVVQRMAL
jgi:hypothetical protein